MVDSRSDIQYPMTSDHEILIRFSNDDYQRVTTLLILFMESCVVILNRLLLGIFLLMIVNKLLGLI